MELAGKDQDLLNRILVIWAGSPCWPSWSWPRATCCLRIFRMPYRGAYEIVSFLGAVVTAFALGYTQKRKSHIVVDILTETYSRRSQEGPRRDRLPHHHGVLSPSSPG